MRRLLDDWDKVAARLQNARQRFLLFDFDGTLAPIAPCPQQAQMPRSIRYLLRTLTRQKGSSVGIVTGRSLEDIRKQVGLHGILYIGNHGLEFCSGHRHWVHPDAAGEQKILHWLARLLRQNLRTIPGAVVENKTLTLSVHLRRVRHDRRAEISQRVRRLLSQPPFAGRFRIQAGKQVLDVQPRIAWDKGASVQLLRRTSPPNTVLLYIGDDATDEQAFRAVQPEGIAVRVGKHRASAAPYYLQAQKDIHSLMQKLATL